MDNRNYFNSLFQFNGLNSTQKSLADSTPNQQNYW